MEELKIEMTSALELRDRGALLIDTRSPAEYAEATIPGSINIPLFSNEERARVGTCYRQEGASSARLLAVDLVSPRIPELVRAVMAARSDSRAAVVVFCWRGGERSRAMTTFLRLAGIPARQLRGGHKAFRAHVRQFFETRPWGRLVVLRGLTGVGKTRFLSRLREQGYPVIDLEGLANHRGSAFGALGCGPQPSQKMFESLLWDILRKIPGESYALAEGESRHIGRLQLPSQVYASLQEETSLWLRASVATRVRRILEDYPALREHRSQFRAPILALHRRLGKSRVDHLLRLLENEAWEELVRDLMVLYYDPLYRHSMPESRIEIDVDEEREGFRRLEQIISAQVHSCRPLAVE